ncbi:MAG TPA: PAS domain S-box protein [Bacteroidales bacterium]|jgi:PAS domain S-box-containing protein|nr:PAS domain S-box protein [Bacteroidales bacterium]
MELLFLLLTNVSILIVFYIRKPPLHRIMKMRIEDRLWFKEFAIEKVSEAAFWMGSNARFIYVNESACHSLGYTKKELLSMTVHDIDPLFPKDLWARHWKELKEKKTFTFESRHKAKDGRILPVEITVNYVEYMGEEYNCAFARDITDRKAAEEALQKSEERYRSFVKKFKGIAYLSKMDWKPIFFHGTVKDITGYEEDEFIAGNPRWDQIIHPEDLPNIFTEDERKLHTIPNYSYEREYRIVLKDGKVGWVQENVQSICYESEAPNRLQGVIYDITERKQAEEALRASKQQLRHLTAYIQKVAEIERTNIAREIHDELAQALTVLKMELTWLKKKLPKGQEPLIERTNTMLKITDKTIGTMKRIATDLRPGVLDDLGLAAAIEWQAEEFQKQTGIKCKVGLDAEDITLDRDRNTAIFRIFQETLTNVARHAKATQVSVSLKEREGKIILTVKDNGKGITKEEIAHPKSYGLMGIRERAKILNGNSIIKGVRGKGSSVTVEIPVQENKK